MWIKETFAVENKRANCLIAMKIKLKLIHNMNKHKAVLCFAAAYPQQMPIKQQLS